jgi:hypothetical protein
MSSTWTYYVVAQQEKGLINLSSYYPPSYLRFLDKDCIFIFIILAFGFIFIIIIKIKPKLLFLLFNRAFSSKEQRERGKVINIKKAAPSPNETSFFKLYNKKGSKGLNNYLATDYMLGTILFVYRLLFINTAYLSKLDVSRNNNLLNSQNNDTTISLIFPISILIVSFFQKSINFFVIKILRAKEKGNFIFNLTIASVLIFVMKKQIRNNLFFERAEDKLNYLKMEGRYPGIKKLMNIQSAEN